MVLSWKIQLPAEIAMVTLIFWCQGIYTVRWFHGWNPQDNAGDKCLGNMIRKLAACIFSHQLCIQSCWGSLIVHSHISIIFSALSCWSCCCSLLLSSAPLVPSELPSLLTCSSHHRIQALNCFVRYVACGIGVTSGNVMFHAPGLWCRQRLLSASSTTSVGLTHPHLTQQVQALHFLFICHRVKHWAHELHLYMQTLMSVNWE